MTYIFAICDICFKRLFVPRLVNGYARCDSSACQNRAREKEAKRLTAAQEKDAEQ